MTPDIPDFNGPDALGALKNLSVGRFGLTFEEQGLRARVAIDRQGVHESPR